MKWSRKSCTTYSITFSVHCIPICIQYQSDHKIWSPHLPCLCSDRFSPDNTVPPPFLNTLLEMQQTSHILLQQEIPVCWDRVMALCCLSLQVGTCHMDWEKFALASADFLWCFLFLVVFPNASSTPLQHLRLAKTVKQNSMIQKLSYSLSFRQ